ncbi:helix-turn-helix transcriptional regulator [Sphingobacterium sp.]|uniref:response regulator transcription factor n=1 Tax=Sphingobacterium sp. TaxID=341027 RepID=UPI0028AE8B88|nr:helix-turn-helix transcriptional regulator [Sphingobacterium sp.]
MKKRIYAGMVDNGVEFFKDDKGRLFCSHNWKQYQWPDFPKYVIDIIQEEMLADPLALKELAAMDGLTPEMYEFKFACCRFGGLDDVADVDPEGNVHQSEYVPCPLRGECKAEGKLCLALQVKNGYLTKREIEVLRLVQKSDKVIADILNVSIDTVVSHLINIRTKTELENKAQLAVFATKKGII